MTRHEDEYRNLRLQHPDDRRAWLRAHCPAEMPAHWWLALVEHAEFDASPLRERSIEEIRQNIEFAVSLLAIAAEEGMPPRYVVSRLARIAMSILRFGQGIQDIPEAVTPEGVVRRALASFRLTDEAALAVAARLRASASDAVEVDGETEALGDINWLLPDLDKFVEYVEDERVRASVARWLSIAPQLSAV